MYFKQHYTLKQTCMVTHVTPQMIKRNQILIGMIGLISEMWIVFEIYVRYAKK